MDFERILNDARDTLTVIADIQRRQAAVLKDHSQGLEDHDRSVADHRARMAEHDARMAKFDERMLDITEKLDALIRGDDGFYKQPE